MYTGAILTYTMQTPEGPVGIYWEESDGRPNAAYPLPTELKSVYQHLERDYASLATDARSYGIDLLDEVQDEESLADAILFARCKADRSIDWERMKHPACNPVVGFLLSTCHRTVAEPEDFLQLCVYSSDPFGQIHGSYWDFDPSTRTWCGAYGDPADTHLFEFVDPSNLPQGHQLQAEFAGPSAPKCEGDEQ